MEKDASLLSAGWRRAGVHLARLAVLPIVGTLVLGPAVTAHAVAPTATICLLSSTGATTPGASVEDYSGTWRAMRATGADLAIVEGGTAVLGATTFTDLEPGARHTATILWGDGSAAESAVVSQVDGLAGAVAGSHT